MPAAHKLRIPLQLAHFFARHDMDYRRFPPVELPVPTIGELCAERGLRFGFRYLAHGFDDAAELARLERELPGKDVLFFYDPSIDGHGHHAGADVAALRPDIDRVERFLRRAAKLAEAQGGQEVHVLLFSDHGMTNVERTYDIFRALAPFRLGHDYLVFVDSTFARFWYADAAVREGVHAAVANAPAAFLDEAERRRYGIDFADDRYGQEVLVADEGVVFHPSYISPSGLRTRHYPDRATHGYRPEAPTASGICFRRGAGADPARTGPVHATEVFSIVSEITGRHRHDSPELAGSPGPLP
jgi:predicted AlkP superfamily pyrophosphatase or phosphodiesterase